MQPLSFSFHSATACRVHKKRFAVSSFQVLARKFRKPDAIARFVSESDTSQSTIAFAAEPAVDWFFGRLLARAIAAACGWSSTPAAVFPGFFILNTFVGVRNVQPAIPHEFVFLLMHHTASNPENSRREKRQ